MITATKPAGRAKSSGSVAYGSVLLLSAVCAAAYFVWTAATLRIETSPISPVALAGADEKVGVNDVVASAAKPRPETAFPQTVERPLFHPDRRPFERSKPEPAVAVTPPPPPPPINHLQLIGVMQTGANQFRALIRGGAEQPGEWLTVGDQIHGWQLSTIAPDGVTMIVARPAGAAPVQQHKLRLLPGPSASAG